MNKNVIKIGLLSILLFIFYITIYTCAVTNHNNYINNINNIRRTIGKPPLICEYCGEWPSNESLTNVTKYIKNKKPNEEYILLKCQSCETPHIFLITINKKDLIKK